MGREDQVQEMLAVGAALNRRAVLHRHGFEQARPDIGEIRHGAIVDQREGAVYEGMGIDQPDPANRGPAYMSQYRGGLDPRGGRTEVVTVVRRRRPALDAHILAVVGGDAPAVGMLEAAEIAPALDELCQLLNETAGVQVVGAAGDALLPSG